VKRQGDKQTWRQGDEELQHHAQRNFVVNHIHFVGLSFSTAVHVYNGVSDAKAYQLAEVVDIMKRATVNLAIDLLAAALFLGMIATGYILFFTLPPGTNKSLSLWGLVRHEWGQVHFGISVGLLAVLLLHLALHWQWMVATIAQRLGFEKREKGRHIRSGVIALLVVIAVLGLFAWVTEVSVREREDPARQPATITSASDTVTPTPVAIPSVEVGVRINFWNDVYPILESSCLQCHGPRKALGSFRVDIREDYFGGNGHAAFIISGNSEQSPLIAIVDGRRTDMKMAARHKLPEQEIAMLRTWIDAGADWPEKPAGR